MVARQLVDEFARRFQENHGMKIRFTEAAADLLVTQALEQKQPVRDLVRGAVQGFSIRPETGRPEHRAARNS